MTKMSRDIPIRDRDDEVIGRATMDADGEVKITLRSEIGWDYFRYIEQDFLHGFRLIPIYKEANPL